MVPRCINDARYCEEAADHSSASSQEGKHSTSTALRLLNPERGEREGEGDSVSTHGETAEGCTLGACVVIMAAMLRRAMQSSMGVRFRNGVRT